MRSDPKPYAVRTRKLIRLVPLTKISHFSGAGNYVELRFRNGECILEEVKLADIEKKLPEYFFRTHRSHIVNLTFIRSLINITKEKYSAILKNGRTISVSRKKLKSFAVY